MGTTLPLLPRTLPNRTEAHLGISTPDRRAETMRSQTRLVAPLTQIGLTALSEEIIRRLRTLWRRDARSRFQAPRIFFFFNDTATTEIYTLSLHDALPI